jgi:uncharacterized protein (TIGR01244 family)
MSNGDSPDKCSLPVDGACFNLDQYYVTGSYYVTGQPVDPQGLDAIKSAGISSVISFRDPTEQGYDANESSTLIGMGIGFLNIPIIHGMAQDIFNQQATAFAGCIIRQQTPLLIHCSTGDRASGMWAVHMFVNGKIPLATAIQYAQTKLALQNPGIVELVTNYQPTS